MKTLRGSWLVAVAVTFAILAPPAHAQKTTLPPETLKASPNLSVAKRQLQMANDLGRQVLQTYRAALANDGIPIDENLVQPARNTYALIRAARESMEQSKQYMKYPDPMFELAYKRVTDAWNISRTPVEKYTWSLERSRYLSMSVQDLDRALRLVDQALVILA